MKNPVHIKICGMRDPENIREVGALLPEYMGFIFYAPSPRYVGDDFQLPEDLPESIRRVGVFVDESVARILELSQKHRLALVQLHGDEPVAVCRELKRHQIKVIKVFRIGASVDFSVLNPYKEVVDYFLFDTKGKYYGGNAKTFDWEVLKTYDQEIPFFLSGGLNSETMEHISELRNMNLHALDLNSGVERKPGVKSVEKINQLIDNLKPAYAKSSGRQV